MKNFFDKFQDRNNHHKRNKDNTSSNQIKKRKLFELDDLDEEYYEEEQYEDRDYENDDFYEDEAYEEGEFADEDSYETDEYEETSEIDVDYESDEEYVSEDDETYEDEEAYADEDYVSEDEAAYADEDYVTEDEETYVNEDYATEDEEAYEDDDYTKDTYADEEEDQDDDLQVVDLDITQNIELLDDDLLNIADSEQNVVDEADESDAYDENAEEYYESDEYAAGSEEGYDEFYEEDSDENFEADGLDGYDEENDVSYESEEYGEDAEQDYESDAYDSDKYDNEAYDDLGYENEADAYESIDDTYTDDDESYYSEEEGDEAENLYYFGQQEESGHRGGDHGRSSRKSETVASIFGMTSGIFGGHKGGKHHRDDGEDKENKIVHFFKHMTVMDGILMTTGVAVLLIAVVTGSMWVAAKETKKQIAAIAPIGQELSSIGVIGESGLLALNDARLTAANAEPVTEEEQTTTEEVEEGNDVSVSFTSMEKDLKIKFTYKDSDKLVTGTEFEVVLTNSKGKETTLKDDDKDGVIYQDNMTAGTYDVIIKSVGDFHFPETSQKVTVKDKIEYVVVNVKDEIKKESEVNVAVEDTAQQNVVQETPTVSDTVEWVESTKTAADNGGDGYEKVSKDTITDPSTLSMLMTTRLLESVDASLNQSSLSLNVGDSGTLSGKTYEGSDHNGVKISYEYSWSSSDSSVASVDNGKVTAKKAGTATITYQIKKTTATTTSSDSTEEITITVDEYNKLSDTEKSKCTPIEENVEEETKPQPSTAVEESEPSSSAAEVSVQTVREKKITGYQYKKTNSSSSTDTKTEEGSATCTVTVTEKDTSITSATLTLNKSNETINVGGTVTITPSKIEYKKADGSTDSKTDSFPSISWSSSDNNIASVSDKGEVKGVKAGSVTITAKATGVKDKGGNEIGIKAECKVTVNAAAELTLTLDQEKATVAIGKTVTIKPTVTNAASDSGVTWATDDKKIATVDDKGVVTGVKAGTVKITATTKEKKASTGEKLTATCTITVGSKAQLDTETLLKDNAGRQVYIKVDGKYQKAVYADYYTAEKFYILNENYKYTGWQTIDNKTYFFDKKGNAVTGTQIIQGVEYKFTDEGVLKMNNNGGSMGIDVSKWNGSINWSAVKNSGVDFVIIRCGYRGSSTGALIQDPTFATNIKGAKNAGLKVGVYFFTQAVNEAEAVEEASMAVALSKSYGLTYPIFIDTEGSGGRADGISKDTRTAVCKAFCQTVANGGCKAGIYASKSWYETKLSAGSLSSYKIWLAQYATKPTYGGRYDMWQYSSKGTVGGINGKVDMNISYLGY